MIIFLHIIIIMTLKFIRTHIYMDVCMYVCVLCTVYDGLNLYYIMRTYLLY